MNRFVSLLGALGLFTCATQLFGQGSPTILWKQDQSDRINSVVFSPDGQTLISGSSDRLIKLWRVSDGALTLTLNSSVAKVHENSTEWVAVSSDGTRIASCSYKVVKLWKLPAGSEQRLTGHNDWVVGVAFSPGGTYLASASFDGTIKIWRGSDGALVKTLNVDAGEMRSVSFSPNGQYLAGAGGDGAIRIWQLSDWSLVQTLEGHTQDVYVVSFSPDGASLASGSYDHTARVWNTATWKSRYTINASGNVYALAFTKDSDQLAISDGESNHILVYRVSNGSLVKRFDQQVDNVQTIAFSQGGQMGYGRADATIVLANYSGPVTTPPQTTPPPKTPPPTTPPPTAPPPEDPPPTTPPPDDPEPSGGNPLTILLQHSNGSLAGLEMDGTNRLSTFPIYGGKSPGGSWRICALGNFDGNTGYIWQNQGGTTALWYMNGPSLASSSALRDGKKIDAHWRVVGTGDFNQDGQTDVVFQNNTGSVRLWTLAGDSVEDSSVMFSGRTSLLPGWKIMAIDDFNHDGNPDLVIEHTRGDVQILLMNGTTAVRAVSLPMRIAAGGWRITGTADFNGDGQTDILLQSNSRYVAVWLMNGTTYLKGIYLNNGKRLGAGWRVVGVTK